MGIRGFIKYFGLFLRLGKFRRYFIEEILSVILFWLSFKAFGYWRLFEFRVGWFLVFVGLEFEFCYSI